MEKSKTSGASKILLICAGILTLIAGIYAVFNPIITDTLIPLFIAIIFIVNGAINCWDFFTSSKKSGWTLALAIIEVVAGILILGSDLFGWFAITYFVAYATAITLIVIGCVRAVNSFSFKSDGLSSWWAVLVLGIIDVLMGLIIFFNPLTIGIYVGAGLIAEGVSELLIAFMA